MSNQDTQDYMRRHKQVKAKLDVTGASGSRRTINVKSKVLAMLLPLLLPLVRNTVAKNLNKAVSWVSGVVGSALVSSGVTNDQLSAYGSSHEAIIAGAAALVIGLIGVALEWGATKLSLKVNPTPTAIAMERDVTPKK